MKLLIVGCGYVGSALARARQGKDQIWGVTMTEERHPSLRSSGIEPVAADVRSANWTHDLPDQIDAIINTISSGGADYREIYWKSNYDLLQKYRADPPRYFIYTSSTSVYTQIDSRIVSEDAPAVPTTNPGQILLDTEQLLLSAREFSSMVILRLAGIYGPGRHALLDDLREGMSRFSEDPTRWVNQIHCDDAASAIAHLLEAAPHHQTYNVVDDEPVRYGDLLAWLAGQLGIPPPIYDAAAPKTRTRQGPRPHRRISNSKLRATGWKPRFPSYREGMAGILRSVPPKASLAKGGERGA